MIDSPAFHPNLRRFPGILCGAWRRTGRFLVLASGILLAAGTIWVGTAWVGTAWVSTAWADSAKLPLPRFASLDSSEINLRAGPGESYPKLWLYQRDGLPVEIIEEFNVWRRVRDPDGIVGWVKGNLLSGKRTAIVTDGRRAIRDDASETARIVAYLDPGVIGRLLECRDGWCRLEVKGYKGWIPRGQFWGAYPDEDFKE